MLEGEAHFINLFIMLIFNLLEFMKCYVLISIEIDFKKNVENHITIFTQQFMCCIIQLKFLNMSILVF